MRALFPAFLVSLLAFVVIASPLPEDPNELVHQLFADLALRQYEKTHPNERQDLKVTKITHAHEQKNRTYHTTRYDLEFVAKYVQHKTRGAKWDCSATVLEKYLINTYVVKDVSCTKGSRVNYSNDNMGDGRYKFGFEQTDGQRRNEVGEIKNKGSENAYQVVKGSYSWIGPDGVITVTYVADEKGLQPEIETEPKPTLRVRGPKVRPTISDAAKSLIG